MNRKSNREVAVHLLACLPVVVLFLVLTGCRREPVYNGKPLHEWVSLLQDQSIDSSPSPTAIEAEKAVQTIGPAAVPWLIEWTKNPPDSTVETSAAFKVLGPQASSAIPELARILQHKPVSMDDDAACEEAANAISYLGPEAIPYMFAAFTNGVMPIQNFGNLGTNGESVIPALIAWASDSNSDTRVAAIDALAGIAMEPDTVIPVLRGALKDTDPKVRSSATIALGCYGKAASVALTDLMQMQNDPDSDTRDGVIDALGKIGDPNVVLPLLLKKLHDPDSSVREDAALALGDLGGQKAFDALMQAIDDPDGRVRRAIFLSLKQIDPEQLANSGKTLR